MIVYPPGDVHSNAAAGKTVTASDGVDYGGSLAGLVDGDLSTYFHSSDSSDNWVMVDLGEEIAIGGIFLYQTENLGGFYRAVGLYAEILDASQNTVLTTAAVWAPTVAFTTVASPALRPGHTDHADLGTTTAQDGGGLSNARGCRCAGVESGRVPRRRVAGHHEVVGAAREGEVFLTRGARDDRDLTSARLGNLDVGMID